MFLNISIVSILQLRKYLKRFFALAITNEKANTFPALKLIKVRALITYHTWQKIDFMIHYTYTTLP